VVAVINVLAAAALLFGAIYNLYYVSNEKVKLGSVTVYTVAFAVCVACSRMREDPSCLQLVLLMQQSWLSSSAAGLVAIALRVEAERVQSD
jgi:hypothetical protein